MTRLTVPSVATVPTLTVESRMIATPWSRLVRGLGLGQHPTGHDPVAAAQVREAFALLAARVSDAHTYTRFGRHLCELVLQVTDPTIDVPNGELERLLAPTLDAVRAEPDPYLRLMAGCILMDSFAKLKLDPTPLLHGPFDVALETLAVVEQIEPDRIQDENRGRHGAYERLSGYSAVLLAHGQLGLTKRLVTRDRDHIREALGLLDEIPSPFFRGRGGSMLLSVVALLGFGGHITGAATGGRDHIEEVLEYLDRANELDAPSFPGPMTPAFARAYPLLTMLNAIAMTGREQYLQHRGDRLRQAKHLVDALSPVERTHMGLYYLVGLHDLGKLHEQLPHLDTFVEDTVGQWRSIDPGADFFLNGIAYPYIFQTAMFTSRPELVTDEAIERLVGSFSHLDHTPADRVNRPYPLSYAFTALGEIGAAERLFVPDRRYNGCSAFAWVAQRLSVDARAEAGRFPLLIHALINAALRLRDPAQGETELFRGFRFPLG